MARRNLCNKHLKLPSCKIIVHDPRALRRPDDSQLLRLVFLYCRKVCFRPIFETLTFCRRDVSGGVKLW